MPQSLPTQLNWVHGPEVASNYLAGAELGLRQEATNAALMQHNQQLQMEQQQLDAARIKAQQEHDMEMQRMQVQKAYYDQSMSLRKQQIIENQQRIRQAMEIGQKRWEQQKDFQMMVEKLRLQGQESMADRQIKAQEAATQRAEKAQRDRALGEIIQGAETSYRNLQKDYAVKKDPDIKAQMDEQERIINNAMKQVDPSLKSLYTGGETDVVLENGRLVYKDPSKRKTMAPQVGAGPASMVPPQASLPKLLEGLNILNPAGWAIPNLEKLAKSPSWDTSNEDEDSVDVTGWRNPQ